MARKKSYTNKNGKKSFERKIPEAGLRHLEKLTRPKNQATPSIIKPEAVEEHIATSRRESKQ